MKIVHVSAECYPIAKIGGLADVVGSLPKYQNRLNENASVVMPFYNNSFTQNNNFKVLYEDSLTIDKSYNFQILELEKNALGFTLYFVDVPELLFKDYVYSNNDTDRFLAFQIATLNWIVRSNNKPDIIHCHDHHTGLIPFMMSYCYDYQSLKETPSILTIHNAQYQGWFSHNKGYLIPRFDVKHIGLLDWDNCINPLATAIKCAWKVNTVSPSYMEELKEKANGLEGLLTHEGAKCSGILNGIDTNVWNPETDRFIIKNYTVKTIASGKKANKRWLCNEFNLDPKRPLFAFIGRLVGEKGADLFPEIFDKALGNNKISLLLLGSGHEHVQQGLEGLKDRYIGAYNAFIGYDEKLSHIIYAGADFLLMPSRVEPCGLNQMYSLRYGTIPVVNNIGGLKDTIIDISKDDGFGIKHDEADVNQVVKAITRARQLYEEVETFKQTRKYIMAIDHSWNASANAYIQLYKSIK